MAACESHSMLRLQAHMMATNGRHYHAFLPVGSKTTTIGLPPESNRLSAVEEAEDGARLDCVADWDDLVNFSAVSMTGKLLLFGATSCFVASVVAAAERRPNPFVSILVRLCLECRDFDSLSGPS